MRFTDHRPSRAARVVAAAAVLAAGGTLTVTFVSGGGRDSAAAATTLDQYGSITDVPPNVATPARRRGASTGRFTVDCGTNGNGKFSPDNPVAQPGIVNGAEHLHDFVGNLAITANSSDADLAASGTTCRNGDRSSYFWPVVRIDDAVRPDAVTVAGAVRATVPTVTCPRVSTRLPAIPWRAKAAVDAQLRALSAPRAEAERRLAAVRGTLDPEVNSAGLATLRTRRADVLRRIRDLIVAAGGQRPANLIGLAECDLSYDALHALTHGEHPAATPSAATPSASAALPVPQGRDRELPNNTGGIVRPAAVRIEYRGNAAGPVVPMPKFLRELTGDAKPTSRGPANARATWTCSGFTDRLSAKYPICPRGSRVTRVQDFPGCWDGTNIDSANHRSHVAFADRVTGACPTGFRAIPQLRITISYDIARDDQTNGRYALDSFPEENHNPFSDHNDFINVNSTRQMQRIAACLNTGRQCS